jgi:hypothetical protein
MRKCEHRGGCGVCRGFEGGMRLLKRRSTAASRASTGRRSQRAPRRCGQKCTGVAAVTSGEARKSTLSTSPEQCRGGLMVYPFSTASPCDEACRHLCRRPRSTATIVSRFFPACFRIRTATYRKYRNRLDHENGGSRYLPGSDELQCLQRGWALKSIRIGTHPLV